MAKTQKQPKCPSTDEWIKKMWWIYTESPKARLLKKPVEEGLTYRGARVRFTSDFSSENTRTRRVE